MMQVCILVILILCPQSWAQIGFNRNKNLVRYRLIMLIYNIFNRFMTNINVDGNSFGGCHSIQLS